MDNNGSDEEGGELICVRCGKEMMCNNIVEDIGQLCARCNYNRIFYMVEERK